MQRLLKYLPDYFLLIFLLFPLSGCRKLVQSEFPDFEKKPVINAILVENKPLTIHVSLSAKIDSNRLEVVDNAEVYLFENDQIIEKLTCEGKGVYTSENIVKAGNTYSCEVLIAGYNKATCKCTIPEPVCITDVKKTGYAGTDEDGYIYSSFSFTIKNNSHVRQYFEVVLYNENEKTEKVIKLFNVSDPVLQYEGIPSPLFSNELMSQESYTMNINIATSFVYDNASINNTCEPRRFVLRTVNYEYYMYVKQLYFYESGRFPDYIGSTLIAAPLFSNVENGYGIFAGYSSCLSDTICM